jgi:hypothetical protein
VYHDGKRSNLTATYHHPKIEGIHSVPGLVTQLDFILTSIEENSDRGDWVFVYPNYPTVYYLTDRRNPSPIPWFYYLEYTREMETDALRTVAEHEPKVILVPPKERPPLLDSMIESSYETIDRNPWFIAYKRTE